MKFYIDICIATVTFTLCYRNSFFSYLGLRFCYTNKIRLDLLASHGNIKPRTYNFALFTTYLYVLALCLFPIIFVCDPTKSVYGHSIPFMFLILANYGVYMGLYIVFEDEFETEDKYYLAFVGLVSVAFPICVLSEYIAYDYNGGHKSSFPHQITKWLDRLWYFCLYFSDKFLPAQVVLTSTYDLGVCIEDASIIDDEKSLRSYEANDITPMDYTQSKIIRLNPQEIENLDSLEVLDSLHGHIQPPRNISISHGNINSPPPPDYLLNDTLLSYASSQSSQHTFPG